jgi:hypothetical protein
MPALKKPFALLLILSHLNAFVLGSVGNVYAAEKRPLELDFVCANLGSWIDEIFKTLLGVTSTKVLVPKKKTTPNCH